MRFEDVCFQVTGICSDGFTLSRYRIDGRLPKSSDYNFTHNSGSGFMFCLLNVSRMTVVTEWCDIVADNQFCLPSVSVLTLLSRIEVQFQPFPQPTGTIIIIIV